MDREWSLEALQEKRQPWALSSCKARGCLSFWKHGHVMHEGRRGKPQVALSDQLWAAEFKGYREKLERFQQCAPELCRMVAFLPGLDCQVKPHALYMVPNGDKRPRHHGACSSRKGIAQEDGETHGEVGLDSFSRDTLP